MEVYDLAHQLARALAKCGECAEFAKARDGAAANEETRRMLQDYYRRQAALIRRSAAGEEPAASAIKELEQLREVIAFHPLVKELFAAEHRLLILRDDVLRIIVDGMRPWFDLGELAPELDAGEG